LEKVTYAVGLVDWMRPISQRGKVTPQLRQSKDCERQSGASQTPGKDISDSWLSVLHTWSCRPIILGYVQDIVRQLRSKNITYVLTVDRPRKYLRQFVKDTLILFATSLTWKLRITI
jgi:hypothetical protein